MENILYCPKCQEKCEQHALNGKNEYALICSRCSFLGELTIISASNTFKEEKKEVHKQENHYPNISPEELGWFAT